MLKLHYFFLCICLLHQRIIYFFPVLLKNLILPSGTWLTLKWLFQLKNGYIIDHSFKAVLMKTDVIESFSLR